MDQNFFLIKNKYSFYYKPNLISLEENTIEELSEEISLFLKELTLFNINLKSLCRLSPNIETKNLILNIAYAILDDEKIYTYIRKNRSLPVKKLANFTYESKAFIEKWESYLIAYLLIVSKKRYSNLKNYLNIKLNDNDYENENFFSVVDNQNTGTVLKIKGKTAYIMTSSGDFKKIKVDVQSESSKVGSIIIGKVSKSMKIYFYPVLVSIFSLLFLSLIALAIYKQPYITIVMDMNASVKMEVNRFNQVVSCKGTNSKGKEIASSINIDKKPIDEYLKTILYRGKEMKIIDKKYPIYIYINGNTLKDEELKSTIKFIKENKIDARINNNGNEYDIDSNKD